MLLRRAVGAALRRARQRQGRTLREVAAAAQVSLPYLSEVERGRKEASSEVLAAICRALGIHLHQLLDDVRDDLAEGEAHDEPAAPPQASRSPSDAQRRTRPSRTSGPATAAHRAVSRAGWSGTRLRPRPERPRVAAR